ncbi:MAG: fimbrillin family protein [Parabacteroides sp.]|nr:fimbrillin family protein [Parabacteroides sp.]
MVTKTESTTIEKEFSTTVFATKRDDDYTNLSASGTDNEWIKDATVTTAGAVTFTDNPVYPKNGDWIYLVAVAPKIASAASYNGTDATVTYTLDGKTDLLYASQIQGNRWDGSRFSNNTDQSVEPLEYAHLLTQLKFKAKKVTAGLTVNVKKITVGSVKNTAKLVLATGTATFDGNADLSLSFGGDDSDGTAISGTKETDATVLEGALLLPPLGQDDAAYTLIVETSVGTFKDVPIEFSNGSGSGSDNQLKQGVSHDITLEISDRELEVLSVTVAEWTSIPQGGELDLIN